MLSFHETARELAAIDHQMARGNRDIPKLFRHVSLDDFGKLLLDVPSSYPNIKGHFPTMAPDDIQRQWTGASGDALLKQTTAFVRSALSAYHEFVHRDTSSARVLDFGCGYGRIIRLMYKFFSEANIFGVDPSNHSIELCRQHGMRGHFALSDWIPRTLPCDGPFDLIYAFSVFTHLSEKVAEVSLGTLRNVLSESGLLVMSIRPEEYWHHHEGGKHALEMKSRHALTGFAFLPHNRTPIEGEVTYGDTSMSIDYIKQKFTGWQVVGVDWNMCDHFQVLVYLKPTK
jgi:SAM-dependent methyltransferase